MILISPRKTAQFLTFLVLGITTVGLITQFFKVVLGRQRLWGLAELFNLDNEANIPSWYSACSLMFCAILLGMIALIKKQESDRFVIHWTGLSFIFSFLSLDEAISLHEKWIPSILHHSAQAISYSWLILGICFTAIVALLYLPFLIALPINTRRLICWAGIVFLSGALGVEWLSNFHADRHGEENMLYALMVFFEELLEMLGVVIFIYALLSYMATNAQAIYIRHLK